MDQVAPELPQIGPGDFLGLDEPWNDPEKARFVVLPVSYEKTTTYIKGTAGGPRAILEASRQVELFDEELWKDFSKVGITTYPEVLFDAPPQDLAQHLEQEVAELFRRGKRVLMLGGEHSISLGPVRAAARYWPDLTVLQLDAHADLRETYQGTRFGHASIAKRISQECPITQVGVRSLSEEEADLADKGNITTLMARDVLAGDLKKEIIPQILESLDEHVYITFDVDVFDPSFFPGTGTPEPGGLGWYSVCDILRAVIREKDVVAMDIVETVPLSGHFVSEFAAARLAYKFICYTAQHQKLGQIATGK